MKDGERKDKELKRIPRNPNMQITDDEVEKILKEAAAQVSDGKKKKGQTVEQKAKSEQKVTRQESSSKPVDRKTEQKPKATVKTEQKPKTTVKAEQIPKTTVKADQTKQESASKKTDEKSKQLSDKNRSKTTPQTSTKNVTNNKELKNPQSPSLRKIEAKKEEKTVPFSVEDEVIVTKNVDAPVKEDRVTVGNVIGTILEGIWTCVKLVVLVTIITAVAGFLLSRDMMVRGRSGNRKCLENMTISQTVMNQKEIADVETEQWLDNVKREKLTMEADDKKILVARRIVTNAESDKWVVLLHGYNGSMEDVYDLAKRYSQEGYNILMPDLRAHGESEGSLYGMGWLDRLDVINWIDRILEEQPSANIVVHGIDIGGATALMMTGEPLKGSIKAVVAEGAYTSAWDVVKSEYTARHEKLPAFPFMNMMNPVMKVWAGYSLKEADAVEQVAKSKTPILLIRGQNDTYVTEEMTNELDQAIASSHEVYVVPTGAHEDCRFAEPENYYNKTFDFLNQYVK